MLQALGGPPVIGRPGSCSQGGGARPACPRGVVSSGEGQARVACPCACLVIPRELPQVPRAVGQTGGSGLPPLSPHTPLPLSAPLLPSPWQHKQPVHLSPLLCQSTWVGAAELLITALKYCTNYSRRKRGRRSEVKPACAPTVSPRCPWIHTGNQVPEKLLVQTPDPLVAASAPPPGE